MIISLQTMLNEGFDLPTGIDSQTEKLANFIGSFYLPDIEEELNKAKEQMEYDRIVKYEEYFRLAKQYQDEGKRLFTVKKTVTNRALFGKTTLAIHSKNKKLPRVHLKMTDGYDNSNSGQVSEPPNPEVFVMTDKYHFVKAFKKSLGEFTDTLKHEIRHYFQFTTRKGGFVGLPKRNVLDKRTDAFGTANIHGYPAQQPHELTDIEFKPNVHTYAYYIKKYLNRNQAKDKWVPVFKKIATGIPIETRDRDVLYLIDKLRNMRNKDVEKWRQFVKELYKEVFLSTKLQETPDEVFYGVGVDEYVSYGNKNDVEGVIIMCLLDGQFTYFFYSPNKNAIYTNHPKYKPILSNVENLPHFFETHADLSRAITAFVGETWWEIHDFERLNNCRFFNIPGGEYVLSFWEKKQKIKQQKSYIVEMLKETGYDPEDILYEVSDYDGELLQFWEIFGHTTKPPTQDDLSIELKQQLHLNPDLKQVFLTLPTNKFQRAADKLGMTTIELKRLLGREIAESTSPEKTDYIGTTYWGPVDAKPIPDAQGKPHKDSGLVSGANSNNWRYYHKRNVVMWNMEPEEEDKTKVDEWLRQRGITGYKHKVLYKYYFNEKEIIREVYHDNMSDDEKMDNACSYFSIGQEEDEKNPNYCWIWNGNDVIAKRGGTHGFHFGHEVAERNFKGWYDIEKNTISVVFPNYELRKLGDKKPTEDDIPQYLHQKLINKFGKRKPNFMVFESTIPKGIDETMTYNDLSALADKSPRGADGKTRPERAPTVRVRSIPVSLEDGKESWNFRYSSNPSNTAVDAKEPLRGSIEFFKEIQDRDRENAADLPCKVDCNCRDFRYRWAYNDYAQNASKIGPDSLNKCINRSPKPAYDLGEGLCKHLIALERYLRTRIRATGKSNLFEAMNEVARSNRNFNIEYYD